MNMSAQIAIKLDVLHLILFPEINEELVFSIIKKNKQDCCIKNLAQLRLDHKIPNDKYAQLQDSIPVQ